MTCRVMKAVPPLFWPLGQGPAPGSPAPADSIGHDGGTWFHVDDTGAVQATDGSGRRFVNSSAEIFADVMTVVADEWRRRATLSDEDADAQTDRIRELVRRLDPAASDGSGTWWSLVLEQMDDGLL